MGRTCKKGTLLKNRAEEVRPKQRLRFWRNWAGIESEKEEFLANLSGGGRMTEEVIRKSEKFGKE